MKSLCSFYKKASIATTLFLGILIFSITMYSIITEQEQEDVKDFCEQGNINRVLEIGAKCVMAFLAGGITSNLRFLKFSHF